MQSKVSVVVVSYNRPKGANETVASLLNQSIKPSDIIVIDNGSVPHLKIEFRAKNLKLIRFDREIGLSNARNYGISIAKGDYVAFIDDDAVADKYWLEEINRVIGTAEILGGPIKPIYQALPPEWWDEKDFGSCAGVGNIWSKHLWGSNLVVKKEVFRTIGLFDPNIGRRKGKLLSFEETDFIERATKRGFKVRFVPTAVVYHKVTAQRMTLSYILKWNYSGGKSLKVQLGYRPLKTCVGILFCIVSLASPRNIISEKPVRIKKIAWMAWLLGSLL